MNKREQIELSIELLQRSLTYNSSEQDAFIVEAVNTLDVPLNKQYRSIIELHIELHKQQADSIRAQGKPDFNKEYPKIESAYLKDQRVEIRMSDGREVSVCLDGAYNPNRIKVLYHSHQWDWVNCYFDNYGTPE